MLSVQEVEAKEAESLVRDYNAIFGNKTHVIVTENELKDIRSGKREGPVPILASKVSKNKSIKFKDTPKRSTRWDD